jgi:hypothetical protein
MFVAANVAQKAPMNLFDVAIWILVSRQIPSLGVPVALNPFIDEQPEEFQNFHGLF